MKQVMYEEKFGQTDFPEGFEETLKNLSLDEQLRRFRVTASARSAKTDWSSRAHNDTYRRLEDSTDVESVIVKDGLTVGVIMTDNFGDPAPCMPEHCVCTYYAKDNNGAGYKERIEHTYLVCVPADFDER